MGVQFHLRPKSRICVVCNGEPAPFTPVARLPDGESFQIPRYLCVRCLHKATRDQIITPQVRAEAVARLYQVYGLSPEIRPECWSLGYIEENSYTVERPDPYAESDP